MNITDLKTTVFNKKPIFGEILRRHGNENLISYYKRHRHTPDEISQSRSGEFLQTIKDLIFPLLGQKIAEGAIDQLRDNFFVSTAGHHDTATNPFFSNHLFAAALSGQKNVISFTCGGISLNNSSFPRGFLFHDNQGREERLHLVSLKNHHHPVYGKAAYTRKNLETLYEEISECSLSTPERSKLNELIESSYGDPKTLELPLLSEQITRGVFSFFKKIPGLTATNIIYLEQETVVAKLLERHHLNRKTALGQILFNEEDRELFLREFNGITGASDSKSGSGTQLFWAVTPKKRVSLWVSGNNLISQDGSIRLPLTPDAIEKGLREKTLMPSMALSFCVLNFYYGLATGGGFSQVNYLSQMKAAISRIMEKLPHYRTQLTTAVPTDLLCGEFSLPLLATHGALAAATPLDLFLYSGRKTTNNLRRIAKQITLGQAVEPMLPELYKIVTGAQPEVTIAPSFPACIALIKCYYCGNNPVPHKLARFNEYMNALNRPLFWISQTWLGKKIEILLERIIVPIMHLGVLLKLVRYNDDIEKASSGRSKVIWEEARRRGTPMRQLIVFGNLTDLYEAQLPSGRTIIFNSLPLPSNSRTDALDWLDDKLELKKRLHAAGLPAARGGAFSKFDPMLKLFKNIEKPVIVKPALGSRGRHTTTFIYTPEQLKQAFEIGKQISRRLVMEEHLVGSVYRATIVNGRLVGILRGDPPRVTGDGKSTIAELITKKNAERHPRVKEFIPSPLTHAFLKRSGYHLSTVLPQGKTIDLTEKIGVSYGGFSAEELLICHPKTKQILEAVGRVVDFPVMGFDFIIGDIARDPDAQKWGVIECNSLPFIDLHHHPLEGPSINVASAVWDLWK